MSDTPRSSQVLKRFLTGRSIATSQADHQLLPKLLALPVFSSDALSSVAYATEEMMLVLALAGAGALAVKMPLAIAIGGLLAIVVISYRQTVKAYPQGGGSYIVAKENLGTMAGLVAAAAILTDYVLTVAVSVTAGTIAVTSAVPLLARHKVLIAIAFVLLITLANLRGVKESGRIFAIPTYGFIAMIFLTLIVGALRCVGGCPLAATSGLPLEPLGALTLFLVLRAFASGATALTGVEAIADGVQAFRRPQARNAAQTLAIMGAVGITMFLGITLLTQALHIRVNGDIAASRSVLSQIGETIYGRSALFYLLQVFTAGILILAANTSFQDFPRLSSILARDRFMPSQFRNRGDRLVFSNGVVVLAVLASALVYVFHAELTRLIQLYVVGVFTAFTLSQTGMVRRWLRTRLPGWRHGAIINGIGATATGVVLIIAVSTKFIHGAWIVIVAVPILVAFFLAVHRHYERVARLLGGAAGRHVVAGHHFLVLVRDFGPATAEAVAHLRAIRPLRVTPLYVGPEHAFASVAEMWRVGAPRLGDLKPLPDAGGGIAAALRTHLKTLDTAPEDFVTIVVPEVVSGGSWRAMLRQRRAIWLKASLLLRSHVVVMDIPYLPAEGRADRPIDRPMELAHNTVLVPISGVHGASERAVSYAESLHPSEIEALYFATEPSEVQAVITAWWDGGLQIPLSVIEAPFRDILPPLLEEIRQRTARGWNVTVVLPEFVVNRWWEHFLHNQSGLFIKRALLLEPRVVVVSVPFHLRGAGEQGGTVATPATT